MWTPNDFTVSTSLDAIAAHADCIYRMVWRFDFSAPGFCWINFGESGNSSTLRQAMVALKSELSKASQVHLGERFVIRSMGRFDQHVTTKFHLDGAPAKSLLML